MTRCNYQIFGVRYGYMLTDRQSQTGSREGGEGSRDRTSLSGEIFEEAVLADAVLEAELLPELHADLVAALPHLNGYDLARHPFKADQKQRMVFLEEKG